MPRSLQLLFIVVIFIKGVANAQQTSHTYLNKLNYLLYLPAEYATDTNTNWPVLIFLHGSSESGTNIEKVKANGPPKYISQGKKYSFIVVSPQSPKFGWDIETVYGLIQTLKKKYKIDKDRIYLTGLSMGGFGAWSLAIKYPGEFAAVVPICGGGDTSQVWRLRHTAVWAFHGAKDNVVPLSSSEDMINALKQYNPDVCFTVYPNAGHDSWSAAYTNDSLYSWLLRQKRFRHQVIRFPAEMLPSYTGRFVSGKQSIRISFRGDKLLMTSGKKSQQLFPSSKDIFFVKEEDPFDVQFVRDSRGTIKSLLIMNAAKRKYTKLK